MEKWIKTLVLIVFYTSRSVMYIENGWRIKQTRMRGELRLWIVISLMQYIWKKNDCSRKILKCSTSTEYSREKMLIWLEPEILIGLKTLSHERALGNKDVDVIAQIWKSNLIGYGVPRQKQPNEFQSLDGFLKFFVYLMICYLNCSFIRRYLTFYLLINVFYMMSNTWSGKTKENILQLKGKTVREPSSKVSVYFCLAS